MLRRAIAVGCALLMIAPLGAWAGEIFSGDLETGDLTQWSSGLDVMPGTTDRLVVVQSPVVQGRYAMKVTVKPGDLNNNGARAEVVLRERWFYKGDEVWFHWYTLFPSDFVPSSRWALYTQWHSDNAYGVPLGFNLHGTKLTMRVMGHSYDAASNWSGGVLWTDTLKTGKWMEFLVHVKWSDKSDGFVEMWKDGQQVVPKTFHANMDPGGTPVYLKWGFYRDKSIDYVQSIYQDGMTVYDGRPDHLFAPQPEPEPEPQPQPVDAGTPIDPDKQPDAGPTDPPADAGPGEEEPVQPQPDGGTPIVDAGQTPRDGGSGTRPDGGDGVGPPSVGCSATSGPAFAVLALVLSVAMAVNRRRRIQ